MRTYLPPEIPNPKRDAERRAKLIVRVVWTIAFIPIVFTLLAFGYSDQAPALLRDFVIAFDRGLGYPVISLLQWLTSR